MKGGESDSDAESDESEDMTERLRRERLESQGMYYRDLASRVDEESMASVETTVLGGHDLPVTCVVLSSDDRTVFSGSKDNSIARWDLGEGGAGATKTMLKGKWSRKTHPDAQSSQGEVLAMATTTDGKYLAAGGRDCLVRIFDLRINQEIKAFQGHRDAVTSMAFKRDSNSLFTGSLDRCVKHWDLNEMGYLETAFGHQDGIYGMDCWNKDRPASASADKTVRHWKISEDSHLVFRGHKSSVDAVSILTPDSLLSGGADGSLCLWKETQKKPVVTVRAAHGFDGDENSMGPHSNIPRWLSCLTCVKMSNLAATGANDGTIKLWNASADDHDLFQVGSIPCNGFVNSLAMSSKLLVAGTGTEHRLGRWWRVKGPLNKVIVYKLPDLGDAVVSRSNGNAASDSSGEEEEDSDDISGDDDEISIDEEEEDSD
jgi:ribosomal RNA-processing protein 9